MNTANSKPVHRRGIFLLRPPNMSGRLELFSEKRSSLTRMDNSENETAVWPPPPNNRETPGESPRAWVIPWRFVWWSFGIGAVLGVFDVTQASPIADWPTVVASAGLAFWRPRLLWFSSFVLTMCLYISHIVAINAGVKTPYVEKNVLYALACWVSLFPNTFSALLGASAKYLSHRIRMRS
ncbi:hypothetical protein [Capsulimonas corticalis]|uniref:hypothetical protein n=1 Tax=Capsulimonas corticalis TaxID=2219043 RepID=UPI000F64A973|nr:hypothetical protein [Capsulimonas corticalis]